MRITSDFLRAALVAAAVAAATPAARAQSVYCTNCSTVYSQATQLAHEVASLSNQATALSYQVQNLARMPQTVYSDVTGATGSLGAVVSSGQLMNGNINGVLSRLSTGSYPTGNYNSLISQLQGARTQMSGNVTNLQSLVAQQQGQTTSDAATLQRLQGQSSGTTGQQQAMNVSNEVQLQSAAQLIKLQQTQLGIAQAMATQNTLQNDRQASMDQQAAALSVDPNTVCTTCGSRF